MALKTDTIELGGMHFVCTALSARVGTRVAAKLINALAPAVKATPFDGSPNEDDIGAMLAPVLSNPELSSTLDFLIDTFAANTIVQNPAQDGGGQPLPRVFDLQFSDAYDDMIAWLLFSIRLSLASFFRGARSLAALLAAQTGKASKSPSSAETTGQSGA